MSNDEILDMLYNDYMYACDMIGKRQKAENRKTGRLLYYGRIKPLKSNK